MYTFFMNNHRLISILAVIVGLVLLVVGYVYASRTAQHLPTWFPGYDASLTKVHTKHAIAGFVLAVGSFILAWFQTGSKPSAATAEAPKQ